MPLTEAEKKTLRAGALAQLQSFSEVGIDILPKKYWAEYAERLANAGKRDDEVDDDDIIELLASKGHLVEPLNLSGAYSLLLSGVIIAELKEKYKDEWPE